MSEQVTTKTHNKPSVEKKTQSARSLTYAIFGFVFLLWVYTLWADRVTPMTNQGRINGQVIRISPQVSGPIASVNISNNESVSRGQVLVNIDKQPFELEVKAARLAIQQAAQSYHADSAAINVAKANEVAARVKFKNAQQHVQRNKALLEKGTISRSTMDDSEAELQSAEANLAQATSALEKAQQEFGPRGEDNPEIQTVLNRLEQALLNLAHTEVTAPNDGVVTNMNLAEGHYASTGQPLLTFVNKDSLWLTAMVRENSLAYLKPGVKVKIVLDAYPGEVFTGEVSSIGWGTSGNGSLQVNGGSGLIESPTNDPKAQRFPVNITFTDLPEDVQLRYSGRAVVGFYPDESYLGERLLDVWMWAWSYISYVS
ncbi:HlyD family secretion protein [Vibrio mimicus]